jgi:hypothetical protein
LDRAPRKGRTSMIWRAIRRPHGGFATGGQNLTASLARRCRAKASGLEPPRFPVCRSALLKFTFVQFVWNENSRSAWSSKAGSRRTRESSRCPDSISINT